MSETAVTWVRVEYPMTFQYWTIHPGTLFGVVKSSPGICLIQSVCDQLGFLRGAYIPMSFVRALTPLELLAEADEHGWMLAEKVE